jgi:hypothetical protein
MRRYCLLILTGGFLLAPISAIRAEKPPARQRRILCNYDGTSTLFTRKESQGPVPITVEDLKEAIREPSYKGSQVDTVLICVCAQVMYYPTKVGTMLGALSTAEDRKKWAPGQRQWYRNLKHFHDNSIDPWAVMLAEAKRRKLEALLSFRMNDGHGHVPILHTKFWVDHPECRYQGHTLDYGRKEVRDHMFLQIQEAVQRYDCDGIELDFNRFPILFKDGTTQERVAKMNELVGRIRKMLDEEGKKRNRRLVMGVRPPSPNYSSPATYEGSLKHGCDPVAWMKNGWIDFVTVSRFLHVTYDLPVADWKKVITEIPVYGCIEIVDDKTGAALTPKQYRRAARHIWDEGADGIYLFNFFITRETPSTEPVFEVLKDLGDPGVTE